MSEQDNTPPTDGSNPEPQEPLSDQASDSAASASESVSQAIGAATEAPPISGTALGLGKMQASEEKTMGMLAHILGGITCIVGPLIIWLMKKDESPYVDDQGKEALNFQITMMIGYVSAAILSMIPVVGCIFGLAYPVIWVVSLVFAILGGLAANKGEVYRYPFALRFVK